MISRKPNFCYYQDSPGVCPAENVCEVVLHRAALADDDKDLVPATKVECSVIMAGDVCVLGGVKRSVRQLKTEVNDRTLNVKSNPADESNLQSHVTRLGPGGTTVLGVLGGDFVHVGSDEPPVGDSLEESCELYLVPALTHDLDVLRW